MVGADFLTISACSAAPCTLPPLGANVAPGSCAPAGTNVTSGYQCSYQCSGGFYPRPQTSGNLSCTDGVLTTTPTLVCKRVLKAKLPSCKTALRSAGFLLLHPADLCSSPCRGRRLVRMGQQFGVHSYVWRRHAHPDADVHQSRACEPRCTVFGTKPTNCGVPDGGLPKCVPLLALAHQSSKSACMHSFKQN
jgi:hypothetical protein